MLIHSGDFSSFNYKKILGGQPSRALLNEVLPAFKNLKFAYFHPRRPMNLLKPDTVRLIRNQKNFDAVIIDHSMEPFYIPNPHALEMSWHTQSRALTDELINCLDIPVIVFHGDPSVNTGIYRFLPSFYFHVHNHPGNKEYCLSHASTQKQHKLSWLNNGLRAQRCHLLTQLWNKDYLNTDDVLYSFYNYQTYTGDMSANYEKVVQDINTLDLTWLEKTCASSTVDQTRSKIKEIWPYLPVAPDNYFKDVTRYDLKWLESIMDISNTAAFSDATANLVSETSIFTHQFLTEKTFKPLAMGMPAFVHHHPHTIKYLENMGFDMYSDIIDHSYDSEENYEKRTSMLINSVDKYMDEQPDVDINRKINNINLFFSDDHRDSIYQTQIRKLTDDIQEVICDK